jgi:lactose/L-arabinose transport system substrate-binding protein
MRTLLISIVAVGLAAGLLLWLSSPPAKGPTAPSPVKPVADASQVKGRVNVWAWNIAAKALNKIAPDFEKTNPNIDVSVDMTGARMQSRLLLSLASGVGAPDVSQFELNDAPRYIATGRLADLTPVAAKYKDRFPANLWKNCVKDGKVYAIPWDMGPCAVYYKRGLFLKYGIDPERIETWDDYIQAGKTILQKSGGRTKMLPLGANSLRIFYEIMIQQNGGQVFDDQDRIAINSPQSQEVLGIIKRIREAGIYSEVAIWSQEFMAGFNSDTIASYPMAVWFAGTIKDTVKDFAGEKQVWGVFRLPAIKPGGTRYSNYGGSVLVIPAQCKNKEAAWQFVEYALCTVEGQVAQYKSMSLYPAYLPALDHPTFDEPDPFFGGQRVGRFFSEGVTQIQALNRTPVWTETNRYLDQALSQWAATGMPTEGFFATLEQKLHRRLGMEISPNSLSKVDHR